MPPTYLREQFLRLSSLPEGSIETQRVERLLRSVRDPGEARPSLERIKGASVPTMTVSGGHDLGHERLCDALSAGLRGERSILSGAGHAVQRAVGFNEQLVSFLDMAERLRPCIS